jgi:hypothetical protein
MPYYDWPCPNCGEINDISFNDCEHCDITFTEPVNVRRAKITAEIIAVNARYATAMSAITSRYLTPEAALFEKEILTKGKAVFNLNFYYLWEWLMHTNRTYQSYRRIVIRGLRQRAEFANDLDRSIVESYLFGSHVDIMYAALSTDELGLNSYGPVSVVLKTNRIAKKTSMLEINSYPFIDQATAAGWNHHKPLPAGHLVPWGKRQQLALIKCQDKIKNGLKVSDIPGMILYSDGNRSHDEFMELYIYGNIIKTVVEKIKIPLSLTKGFDAKQNAQLQELKNQYVVDIY